MSLEDVNKQVKSVADNTRNATFEVKKYDNIVKNITEKYQKILTVSNSVTKHVENIQSKTGIDISRFGIIASITDTIKTSAKLNDTIGNLIAEIAAHGNEVNSYRERIANVRRQISDVELAYKVTNAPNKVQLVYITNKELKLDKNYILEAYDKTQGTGTQESTDALKAQLDDLITKEAVASKMLAEKEVTFSTLRAEFDKELLKQSTQLYGIEQIGLIAADLRHSIGLALKFTGISFVLSRFGETSKFLAQASTDLAIRNKLFSDISKTQILTGAALNEISEAQASLIEYGMEYAYNNRQNLTTMTMMHKALGVSYDTGGRLALVSDKLGANFSKVGDAVAAVAKYTALSAENAARFGNEIGSVLLDLGLMRTNLAGITGNIGALAGAIKSYGGEAEDILSLFKQMGTTGGAGAAALLTGTMGGAFAPEQFSKMLENPEIAKTIGSRLAMLTGGGKNQILVETWAKELGMSSRTLHSWIENGTKFSSIMKKVNEAQETSQVLTKVYNEQIAETGELFTEIKNRLGGLLQWALVPLLILLNDVLKVVSGLLSILDKMILGIKKYIGPLETAGSGLYKVFKGLGVTFQWFASAVVLGIAIKGFSMFKLALNSLTTQIFNVARQLGVKADTFKLGNLGNVGGTLFGGLLTKKTAWLAAILALTSFTSSLIENKDAVDESTFSFRNIAEKALSALDLISIVKFLAPNLFRTIGIWIVETALPSLMGNISAALGSALVSSFLSPLAIGGAIGSVVLAIGTWILNKYTGGHTFKAISWGLGHFRQAVETNANQLEKSANWLDKISWAVDKVILGLMDLWKWLHFWEKEESKIDINKLAKEGGKEILGGGDYKKIFEGIKAQYEAGQIAKDDFVSIVEYLQAAVQERARQTVSSPVATIKGRENIERNYAQITDMQKSVDALHATLKDNGKIAETGHGKQEQAILKSSSEVVNITNINRDIDRLTTPVTTFGLLPYMTPIY